MYINIFLTIQVYSNFCCWLKLYLLSFTGKCFIPFIGFYWKWVTVNATSFQKVGEGIFHNFFENWIALKQYEINKKRIVVTDQIIHIRVFFILFLLKVGFTVHFAHSFIKNNLHCSF